MKVILTADISCVGKRGDLVTVSDGYYRNFLIPAQKAVLPGTPEAKKLASAFAAKAQQQAAEIQAVRDIAARYNGKSITLKAKAKGEKLFGSIQAAEIAAALDIDKKLLTVAPIKTVGTHTVTLQFAHGITSAVTVVVEPS